MKYIKIGKVNMEYRPPLEPTKAFACICVVILFVIYESDVLVLRGRHPGAQRPKPKNVRMLLLLHKAAITDV